MPSTVALLPPDRLVRPNARDFRLTLDALGCTKAELGLSFSEQMLIGQLWVKNAPKQVPDMAGNHTIALPCESNAQFFDMPWRDKEEVEFDAFGVTHLVAGPWDDLLVQLRFDMGTPNKTFLVMESFSKVFQESPCLPKQSLIWDWHALITDKPTPAQPVLPPNFHVWI